METRRAYKGWIVIVVPLLFVLYRLTVKTNPVIQEDDLRVHVHDDESVPPTPRENVNRPARTADVSTPFAKIPKASVHSIVSHSHARSRPSKQVLPSTRGAETNRSTQSREIVLTAPTPVPQVVLPDPPVPDVHLQLRPCASGELNADHNVTLQRVRADVLAYSTELLLRRHWPKLYSGNKTYAEELIVELTDARFDHVAESERFRDQNSLNCELVAMKPLHDGHDPSVLSLPLFWAEYNPRHYSGARENVLNRSFTHAWFDPSSVYLEVEAPYPVQERVTGKNVRSFTISFWMKWKNDVMDMNVLNRLRVIAAGTIPQGIAANGSFIVGTHYRKLQPGSLYISVYIMLDDKLYICSTDTDVFNNEYYYQVSVSFGYDLKGELVVPDGTDFEVHIYVNGVIEAISNQPVALENRLPPTMRNPVDVDGRPYDPETLRGPRFLSIGGMERDVCLRLRRRAAQVRTLDPVLMETASIRACLPFTGYIFDVRVYNRAVPLKSQWAQYERDCSELQNGECITRYELTALEPYFFKHRTELLNSDLYHHERKAEDKLPGDVTKLLSSRFPAVRRFTTLTDIANGTVVYANEDVKFGILQRNGSNIPLTIESDSVYRVRFEGPTLFRGDVRPDPNEPSRLWIHAKFALPGIYQMFVLKQDIGECGSYGLEDGNSSKTAYDAFCGTRDSSLPGVPVSLKVLPARLSDAGYSELLEYLQSPATTDFPVCENLHAPGFWVSGRVREDSELEVYVPNIASADDVHAGISYDIPRGPHGEWMARWQPWSCRYVSFSKARIDRCAASAHIREEYGLLPAKSVDEAFDVPVHMRPWLGAAGDSTTRTIYLEYYERLRTGRTDYFSPSKCAGKKPETTDSFGQNIALPYVMVTGTTLATQNTDEHILHSIQHPHPLALSALNASIRSYHAGDMNSSEVERVLDTRKKPLFFMINYGLHDIRDRLDRRKMVVPATMRVLEAIQKRWPGVLIIFRDFYQLQYNFCLRNAYNQRSLRKMWKKLIRRYNLEWVNAYEMSDPRCDASVDAVHYDSCVSRQAAYGLSGTVSKQIIDMTLTRVCGDV